MRVFLNSVDLVTFCGICPKSWFISHPGVNPVELIDIFLFNFCDILQFSKWCMYVLRKWEWDLKSQGAGSWGRMEVER